MKKKQNLGGVKFNVASIEPVMRLDWRLQRSVDDKSAFGET